MRVTLVDRRNHHLFQPMLYQVATAALNPERHRLADPLDPPRARRTPRCCWPRPTDVDVDARARCASPTATSSPYDYLIVATGARHSYFGHDEWEPLAPGLKSLEDALEIRRRVLLAFERAERETDPVRRHA